MNTVTTLLDSVDVNCDMGEGYGNWTYGDDAALMPYFTTINLACGGHAGDPMIMDRTIDLAIDQGVVVGAHPGFPDKLGFGRRHIPFEPDEIAAIMTYQIGALQGFLKAKGQELHHVKPHGGMYYITKDAAAGEAVAKAIHKIAPDVTAYWPAPHQDIVYTDVLKSLGHKVVAEIYPDLRYTPEGYLIVEKKKKPTDVAFARSQVRMWLTEGKIQVEGGEPVPVEATSLCIHSDGINALEVAQGVRDEILSLGVKIQAES